MYTQIGFKYKKQAKRYLLDTIVSCALSLRLHCFTRATLAGQRELRTENVSIHKIR